MNVVLMYLYCANTLRFLIANKCTPSFPLPCKLFYHYKVQKVATCFLSVPISFFNGMIQSLCIPDNIIIIIVLSGYVMNLGAHAYVLDLVVA